MILLTIAALLTAVGFHASQEWFGGLAPYLCGLVGVTRCPRWLAPLFLILAVGILAVPLVGSVGLPDRREWLLSFACGGFLGDMLSTHMIPTWLSGRRSPGLSTWWAYLGAAIGLAIYLQRHSALDPLAVVLGAGAFVSLWPFMVLLRSVLRQ